MMTTSTAFPEPGARHVHVHVHRHVHPWGPVPPQPEPVLSLEPGLQGAGELSPPQGSQEAGKCHKISKRDSLPPHPSAHISIRLMESLSSLMQQAGALLAAV